MDPAHRNDVTLCIAYYENPGMLERQYLHLASLPAELRAYISLILVDDGSPTHPAAPPSARTIQFSEAPLRGSKPAKNEAARQAALRLGIAGFALYRMDVDVRWNQDACRNLAVAEAKTKWVLLTDMDHVIPAPTWERIIAGQLSWKKIYTFARKTGPHFSDRNPHPNTWLLTVDSFEAAHGYDERFAGFYGTDGDFAGRLRTVGPFEKLKEVIYEVTPEICADCRTVAYERKTPEDNRQIAIIKQRRGGALPMRGLFPWHKVV